MNLFVENPFLRSARPRVRSVGAHWLGILAVAVGLAACSDKKPAPGPKGPTEVGIVTLQPERQPVKLELPGRTNAFLTAEIRPQVGGIVQKRLFTEGAMVKAGQALYQLDPAPSQAAQSSAQAALAKTLAAVNTAEVNARRNAELVKIEAISRQVYDDSQAVLTQARSDRDVAKASLDTARINVGYTRITAPISGRIGTSSVTPGALVTANQTNALSTIQQLDPLYVDVTQSSADLLRLKADMARGRFQASGAGEAPITLKLEDDSVYAHAGKLQFTGVSVNTGTGAVTLRAIVPNPEGLLMPGMYVRAQLEAGVNERAILVPQQAVTRDTAGNASLLVVNADNKVEKRKLTLETATGNRWQVASGVVAGDRVIVDGLQRIKPGDTVKPVAAKAASPGAAASASGAASAAR